METGLGKTKVELRQLMKERLAALTEAEVRAHSAVIWERLSVMRELVSAGCILAYVSKAHEIDTRGLIQQLVAIGKRVCVPTFDGTARRYSASQLQDFHADLTEGEFGILEPTRDTVRPVRADKLDAVLLPGLAFDVHGNRIGRGLGFFDRLLAEARGVRIALAHDFQLLEEVPADTHDVCMDFIVTEKRMVSCKGTNL